MLAAALILGGIGSSTQHPIASSLVAAAFAGPRSRGALGTYNFAGDLGKVKIEAVVRGHERGKKIHVLKFKPKRGYKRRMGARADLTRLEISTIKRG